MRWNILVILFGIARSQNDLGNVKDVCKSEECLTVAKRILNYMNSSLDPCDDFYQFSCGNYLDTTVIPDDQKKQSAFEPLEDIIYNQAKVLLESDPSPDDFESYQLARDQYKACMNADKLEDLGVGPLVKSLEDLGGWPVVVGDAWLGDNFTWWEWTYLSNDLGMPIDILIDLSLGPDQNNATERVLKIDQADLGVSREFLVKGLEEDYVKHYLTYMVEVAVMLGAPKDRAEKELNESVLFEIELAKVTAPKEDRRNASALYNPTTLNEIGNFEGMPPNWVTFVQRILKGSENPDVAGDEKIILSSTTYLENLANLIQKTDKRTLANYLNWRAVFSVVQYLNVEARQIRHKYRKATLGIKAEPPTWKRCVKTVGFNNFDTSSFIFIADSMYVRKYFKPEAKKELEEIVSYLRRSFKEVILKDLDWMPEAIKKRAELKLEAMGQYIAYDDEFTNRSMINDLHKGLEVSVDDFYGSIMQLRKFWRVDNFNKLRKKVDPKSWLEHYLVAMVNAYYDPETNFMGFPAGFLQELFYTYGIPKYLSFGSIGVVIGHEITHGFDDEGKQRNEKGEVENWWDESTTENFEKKAQCMIDQYSNYVHNQVDIKINGINTQGENIADNGGVKESYEAYKLWLKDHKEEDLLPGLDYTQTQLYWINFAQLWCEKYTDKYLREYILTDFHAPGPMRIRGALSNSDHFAKDFNCPVGSTMNPAEKCAVW